MPSPDKIFRLDPVETKITAPVSKFQAVSEVADRSIANRSLGRGLSAFSKALGGLAEFKKQEQIQEDIKTAKDAAVRDEVMPDVLPVAQRAYQNIVDINTSHAALLEIEKFASGEDFDALVKHPDMLSDVKTSKIEAVYDDFYARAAGSMQNPEVIQKLRLSVNTLKEEAYKQVYEAEKNQRTIEGIQGISNIIKDGITFAKATDVPLTETFTDKWVNNTVKDLGTSHPYIPENERKLIAFQTLTANPDIIANQDVIQELMKTQFNKGFTYNNLLLGKGDDAEEFRKIYNTYLQNSKTFFEDIENKQKDADTLRTDLAKKEVDSIFASNPNMNPNDLAPQLLSSGMTHAQVNTKIKAMETYQQRVTKEQLGSQDYNQVRDLILAGVIQNEVVLNDFILAGNLADNTKESLKTYLGQEGQQRKDNVGTYLKSTATIRKTLVGLIKTNLKNKNKLNDLILSGEEPTVADLANILAGSSLDPDELRVALNEVNDLIVDMEALAESNGFADAAAEGDGSVPPDRIKAFQQEIKTRVESLATQVNGVLTPGSELEAPTAQLEVSETEVEVPEAEAKNPFEAFRFNADRVKNMEIDTQQRTIIQDAATGKDTQSIADWIGSFFKSESEETAQVVREDLIVPVPRTPTEQVFFDKLSSGDNPSAEYMQSMKEAQQVPSRVELLEQNTDAALRLERSQPKETGVTQKFNEIQDTISQSFGDLMDIIWGEAPSKKVEGGKSIQDLPQAKQQEVQRQQEGRLPTPDLKTETELEKTTLASTLEQEEGFRLTAYEDTTGNQTIGIGFNLEKAGAKDRIEALGYDFEKVKAGTQDITEDHARELFEEDIETAIRDASLFVNNLDQLPPAKRNVVIEMAYQIGLTRLLSFKEFKKAVEANDFNKASEEILDSLFAKEQAPARAKRLADRMKL